MNTEIKEAISIFLKPTFTIESTHKAIIECAEKLTCDCGNDSEKVMKLFYFVRDSIRYNNFMISVFEEDFKASRILEWGKGYCVQKAVLLTALARSAGIPSRLAFAKIRNHQVPEYIVKMPGMNIFPRHGYNQFFINGRWVSATATFDKGLCDKNGLPTVEFDGISDAVLPEKSLDGKPYIEYLEKFPARADLPFEWIAHVISERVGKDKRPWLTRSEGNTW